MNIITSSAGSMTSSYWRFIILNSEKKIPVMSHGFKIIALAMMDSGVQVQQTT